MNTSQSSNDGDRTPGTISVAREPRDDGPRSIEAEKGFGPALVRAIAEDEKAWTLDTLLDRNPREHTISEHDLMQGIRALRAERAAIEVKQERAKARKDGVNDDDTDDTDA